MTLEDLLLPLHDSSNPESLKTAEHCVDNLFEWNLDNDDKTRRIAERARRSKAVITLLGQREKPGMSQHVVIGQTQTITNMVIAKDKRVADFADFIEDFFEQEAPA